jgi:hypothetical protein
LGERVSIPAEQLYWACSCGRYTSTKPDSREGLRTHQRKARCGGHDVALLPEDIVLEEEMEAKAPPAWEPVPEPPAGGSVPEPMPVAAPPPAGAPPAHGPVASGKVLPGEPGGPTRFRGPAEVPASLYAIYDAFRTQREYAGTIDEWLVECTTLYCEEVLGVELVVTVRWPEPQLVRREAS